jgi:hypothetical protein
MTARRLNDELEPLRTFAAAYTCRRASPANRRAWRIRNPVSFGSIAPGGEILKRRLRHRQGDGCAGVLDTVNLAAGKPAFARRLVCGHKADPGSLEGVRES